jgi:hypothetical protein
MEDYSKQQWWIELQNAMNTFDETSLSKMSDGKLAQYNSGLYHIKNNRNKESSSKGGKIGGAVTGLKAKEQKIGFFSYNEKLTKEELYIQRTKGSYKKKLLNEEQIKFINDNHANSKNQFNIPKDKLTTKKLMEMFGVSKGVILRSIKR